jgi:hypothetical protein
MKGCSRDATLDRRKSRSARELGDLFGVALTPRNRWGGFKTIREKWQAHIEATLIRPVLIIDEAQEMPVNALNELRLFCPAVTTTRGPCSS